MHKLSKCRCFTASFFIFFCASLLFAARSEAAVYSMPTNGDSVVGRTITTTIKRGDSSTTIRQRYDISEQELFEANPHINFNRPPVVGQVVVIPTQFVLPEYHYGIVINTAELRLYYFTPDGRYVYTYPVGLGRIDWRTPLAATEVIRKQYKPTWTVPDSIHDYMYARHGIFLPEYVPPGPDNPLGDYALYLAKRGYLIHGTNIPTTVGTFASSGCMRLNADAIAQLYRDVAIGTPVHIIHHEAKAGWLNGILYLEAHAPIRGYGRTSDLSYQDAVTAVKEVIAGRVARVNWGLVREADDDMTGIPIPVGQSR